MTSILTESLIVYWCYAYLRGIEVHQITDGLLMLCLPQGYRGTSNHWWSIDAMPRDHGWFFKPQLFPIKITLWKRGTFQLSKATIFSSIRQKTAKLEKFKVERLGDQFVTVTMGKSRFDGTKRLAFPPWQRFICIHSDRPVPEIDEGRLASWDQSLHTFCTEEMAETTTPFRKPAWAQMRPSRFRWNLVPRLTDTRRIRISNPLENSSSRNSKKIAA